MTAIIEITDEAGLKAALTRISQIFDAKPGTAEGEELNALTDIVVRYENERIAMDVDDPIEFIKETIDLRDIAGADLYAVFGNRSTAKDVLSGKRKITPTEAQALHELLGVPMNVLVRIVENSAASETKVREDVKSARIS